MNNLKIPLFPLSQFTITSLDEDVIIVCHSGHFVATVNHLSNVGYIVQLDSLNERADVFRDCKCDESSESKEASE